MDDNFEDLSTNSNNIFATVGKKLKIFNLTDKKTFKQQYVQPLFTSSVPARCCFTEFSDFVITTKYKTQKNNFIAMDLSIFQLTPNKLQFVKNLNGHEGRSIRSIKSIDSNQIISIGSDIRIWDIRSGSCEKNLKKRCGLYDTCSSAKNYLLVGEFTTNESHLFDIRQDSSPICTAHHYGMTSCSLAENYFCTSSIENPAAIIWDYNGQPIIGIQGWEAISIMTIGNYSTIILSERKFEILKEFTESMPKKLNRLRQISLLS